MEYCSMYCGSLDGRGVWGNRYMYMVWLTHFTVHLKIIEHC